MTDHINISSHQQALQRPQSTTSLRQLPTRTDCAALFWDLPATTNLWIFKSFSWDVFQTSDINRSHTTANLWSHLQLLQASAIYCYVWKGKLCPKIVCHRIPLIVNRRPKDHDDKNPCKGTAVSMLTPDCCVADTSPPTCRHNPNLNPLTFNVRASTLQFNALKGRFPGFWLLVSYWVRQAQFTKNFSHKLSRSVPYTLKTHVSRRSCLRWIQTSNVLTWNHVSFDLVIHQVRSKNP